MSITVERCDKACPDKSDCIPCYNLRSKIVPTMVPTVPMSGMRKMVSITPAQNKEEEKFSRRTSFARNTSSSLGRNRSPTKDMIQSQF